MSLPSGYKLLEYIESSGTQYINTGFKPNNNTRVVMDLLYTGSESISNEFGAWNSPNNASFICLTTGKNNLYPFYGNTSKQVSANRTVRHTVDMDKNVVKMNGTTMITFNQMSFQCIYPMFLYCFNNVGETTNMTSMRIYFCQIYDNGTLIRDYIPCQTTAGEIGLWDDVNSVFYGNAGTGTFTAGPVLAIAANASEITKLEYIESSGTQYVDSGFIPNGESTVEIAFESAVIISATSGNYPVYGAASNYNSNAFELWSLANGFCTYGSQTYKSGFGLSANVKYVSKQAKNVLEINNQTLTFTKQTFSAPYSLLLFATHRDDRIAVSGSDAKLKIYFCKIYDNGTLIRDYIAAKLSDGTIGLYDKLHGLLYTNVGTGTFIAGPVVTSPSIFVNIDGIWKPINHIYVNINNIWQKST